MIRKLISLSMLGSRHVHHYDVIKAKTTSPTSVRARGPWEFCLQMMIFSSSKAFFVLIVSFCVVQGELVHPYWLLSKS